MKLLLHICCGPCAIYPFEVLKKEGFDITGFFYNPNIHPQSEYNRRKEALEIVSKQNNFELILHKEGFFEDFFRKISFNEEKPTRCHVCWGLRLGETARFASENNFDYFTTTLLVSPYQDIELIKKIGQEIQQDFKSRFFFEDFRPGFGESHRISKEMGLYHQNYCGCVYSEREQIKKVLGVRS